MKSNNDLPKLPDEDEDDTLIFRVKVTRRGGPWRFRLIRAEIAKAIQAISGLTFEGVQTEMHPDPYLFDDPDNISEKAI